MLTLYFYIDGNNVGHVSNIASCPDVGEILLFPGYKVKVLKREWDFPNKCVNIFITTDVKVYE